MFKSEGISSYFYRQSEPLWISNIGKWGYIDDEYYESELPDGRISNIDPYMYEENQDILQADVEPKTALKLYKPFSMHKRERKRYLSIRNRRSRSLWNDRKIFFTRLMYPHKKNRKQIKSSNE